MKRILIFLSLFIICADTFQQVFNVYTVDKKLRDFPNEQDFSSPLKAYIALQNLMINGQDSEVYIKSSFKIRLQSAAWPNREITKEVQETLLNREIKEIITCNDSVAAVITSYKDITHLYRFLNLEQGIWVNGGEDMGKGFEATINKVKNLLPLRLIQLHRTKEVLSARKSLKDLHGNRNTSVVSVIITTDISIWEANPLINIPNISLQTFVPKNLLMKSNGGRIFLG